MLFLITWIIPGTIGRPFLTGLFMQFPGGLEQPGLWRGRVERAAAAPGHDVAGGKTAPLTTIK